MKKIIALIIFVSFVYSHSGRTDGDGCHHYNDGGYHCHISKNTIDNLSSGWHLMGTSFEITDFDIFENVKIVWSLNDGEWKAYAPNNEMMIKIENSKTTILNIIEPNSGFWIQK